MPGLDSVGLIAVRSDLGDSNPSQRKPESGPDDDSPDIGRA